MAPMCQPMCHEPQLVYLANSSSQQHASSVLVAKPDAPELHQLWVEQLGRSASEIRLESATTQGGLWMAGVGCTRGYRKAMEDCHAVYSLSLAQALTAAPAEGPSRAQPDLPPAHQPVLHIDDVLMCHVLCDGHGGYEVARYAALHLVQHVISCCKEQLLLAGPCRATASNVTHTHLTAPLHSNCPLATVAKTQHQNYVSSAYLTPSQLEAALTSAFLQLDASLCDPALRDTLYQLSLPDMPLLQQVTVPYSYGRWEELHGDGYLGPSAGSTAIVALCAANLIAIATVGDSKAWICMRRELGMQSLCKEHKMQDEAERVRILRAGGWVSASGRVNSELDMSRSLGDMEYKQACHLPQDEQIVIAVPDVVCVAVQTQPEPNWQYLLLASDGLSNACTDNEIHEAVIRGLDAGDSPEQVCGTLCRMACSLDRTAFDNVTAMLVLPRRCS